MCDYSLKIHYYTEDLSVPYRYSSSKSPPGFLNLNRHICWAVLKRVIQKGTRLNSKIVNNNKRKENWYWRHRLTGRRSAPRLILDSGDPPPPPKTRRGGCRRSLTALGGRYPLCDEGGQRSSGVKKSHHPLLPLGILLWTHTLHCKDTIQKIRNKYSQKRNCTTPVPIHAFVFLWVIYIFPQSVCLFCCKKIGGPIMGVYWSLEDTWIWKLGLRPRNSFSRKT